jgi:hypothetical protein
MKRLTLFLCAWVYFLLFAGINVLYAQPISDFEVDDDGWSTVGKCPAESAPGTPTWSATGGNPDGHIYATDESVGTFYWVGGNPIWRGDLSAYYGCYLLFDLKTDTDIFPTNAYDVLIVSTDDSTLSYNTAYNPTENVWTSYIVPLFEGSWIVDGMLDADDCPNLTGSAASAADMLNYLGTLKRFRIRAEFSGLSYETNSLDNILIDCDPFLPVELLDFRAYQAGPRLASLEWTTFTEVNCRDFEIQKSTNGLYFVAIGTVPGSGTSLDTINYQFYDDHFTTTSYYRLKQNDYNGDFEYSNIIALTSAVQYEANTIIYPNPATSYFTVTCTQPVLAITITGQSGKKLLSRHFKDEEAPYQFDMSTAELPSGVYYISVLTATSASTQMLEVLK